MKIIQKIQLVDLIFFWLTKFRPKNYEADPVRQYLNESVEESTMHCIRSETSTAVELRARNFATAISVPEHHRQNISKFMKLGILIVIK